jgi:hypothetical protein
MDMIIHGSFDQFGYFFEPTANIRFSSGLNLLTWGIQDEPNVYEVKWLTDPTYAFVSRGRSRDIFENKAGVRITLPNPKFLLTRIHAAIAKVFSLVLTSIWITLSSCLRSSYLPQEF